jgi:hypothetical protein
VKPTISRALAASALAAALLASACTASDSFKLRQPTGQVLLEGGIDLVRGPVGGDCDPGTTVFWGHVRNTGDMDVQEVRFVLTALDGGGRSIGTFTESVYAGALSPDAIGTETASTALLMDQVGTFLVCTPIPWGAAARADGHATFVVVDTTTNPL